MFVVVAILAVCCAAVQGKPADSRPNIVFILADDLGYADIGYHGGAGQIKTPVLDKLAYDGVRLENYYVQPLCTPSRSALMTGRMPIHTGLQNGVITPPKPYGMPLNMTTLPERLKREGYSTHAFGKWHLGMYKEDYLPQSRGFDTFYGYYQGMEDYYTHTVCGSLTANIYCGLDLHNGTTPDHSKNGSYSAHLFTREAERIISEKSKKSSPMFIYLAYQNVHAPLQVPPEYEKPYMFIENKQRRTLAGQVVVLDEAVGNITAALKANDMWNNTILIFSSDNGGPVPSNISLFNGAGCNYPLRGSKGGVWEGGTKVAGFLSGPKVRNPGRVSQEWMHITDWYPTILSMAGASLSNVTVDGIDQWDAISGEAHTKRMEMLYNIDPLMTYGLRKSGSPFDNRQQAALKVGDYKIVTGPTRQSGWYKPLSVDGEEEDFLRYEQTAMKELEKVKDQSLLQNIFLFNITADPYERHDLSQEKPEIVDELLSKLAEYAASAVPPLSTVKPDYRNSDPKKHGGSWEPWQ